MSMAAHQLRASVGSTPTKNSAMGRNSSELPRHIAVQEVFQDIAHTFGTSFVPDLFIGMAARPAYLETAWELFKENLRLDQLECKTKQIIALAITTDEAGTYCIAAYPHAFRLNALDNVTCDTIISSIRFFRAFDLFLSRVEPSYVPATAELVNGCLRDEYRNPEDTRSSKFALSGEDVQPGGAWIGGIPIICFLLLPIAAGVYLFCR